MPNPEPEHCCAKCHDPRTSEDFLKNHLKPQLLGTPAHIVTEHDECAICRLAYGSENLAVMQVDHPYEVTGLPTCNHTFGRACIEQLIRVSENGYLHCPLCRANWCWVFGPKNGILDPMSLKHYYVERQMLIYSCDYIAAWDYFYPSVPKDIDVSRRYVHWEVEDEGMFYAMIRAILELPEYTERITRLQEQCKATLENPGFNPWDPAALLLVGVENPLAYTNWHADMATLIQAIFYAICRSPRGGRICNVLCEVYYAEEASLNEEELKHKAFEAAKDEWRAVQDEGDEEDFVDMLLEITWTYGECLRQDDNESSETASESLGGEEGQDGNSEEQFDHSEASEGVDDRLQGLEGGQEQNEPSKGREQREEVVEQEEARGQGER